MNPRFDSPYRSTCNVPTSLSLRQYPLYDPHGTRPGDGGTTVPDSPRSTRSAPWSRTQQKGLFGAGASPRSVRSATVRKSATGSNGNRSSSTGAAQRFRSSSVESQSSNDSRSCKKWVAHCGWHKLRKTHGINLCPFTGTDTKDAGRPIMRAKCHAARADRIVSTSVGSDRDIVATSPVRTTRAVERGTSPDIDARPPRWSCTKPAYRRALRCGAMHRRRVVPPPSCTARRPAACNSSSSNRCRAAARLRPSIRTTRTHIRTAAAIIAVGGIKRIGNYGETIP